MPDASGGSIYAKMKAKDLPSVRLDITRNPPHKRASRRGANLVGSLFHDALQGRAVRGGATHKLTR